MRTLKATLLLLLAALVLASPARAVNPDEMLDDPALEERARELSAGLRCLVCQNQSIDDSNAELAKDLRVLVRERLLAGDSNQQVLDYLVARYGDYVLLKPRLNAENLVLWGTPIGVLVIAGLTAFVATRRRGPAAEALTAEEEARINALMGEDDGNKA